MARNMNARKHGIGDPSSKYGYDRTGEQFEKDVQANRERSEANWKAFVEFMQSRKVDPRQFRDMFIRYYEEFLEG